MRGSGTAEEPQLVSSGQSVCYVVESPHFTDIRTVGEKAQGHTSV